MKKTEKISEALESNQKEIEKLQTFRQTKPVRQLLRQLFGEQSFLRREISKLQTTKESKEKQKEHRKVIANRNRSEKMKRSWRYFKAIQENYPIKKSLREIRSAFKKHKQGLETDVSEVIWRNPSP